MPNPWEDAPLVGASGNEYGGRLAPRKAGSGPQRPTEQMAKYSLYSMARYDLDDLEQLVSEGKVPGYRDAMLEGFKSPTGIIGPLAGVAQSGSAKQYYATAGRIADSIEKAMTGATATDLEHLRYIASNIPAFYDDPETIKGKISGIRARLDALDSLARGEIPEVDAVRPTPAPMGSMTTRQPVATGGSPSQPRSKQRFRFNPDTGDFE